MWPFAKRDYYFDEDDDNFSMRSWDSQEDEMDEPEALDEEESDDDDQEEMDEEDVKGDFDVRGLDDIADRKYKPYKHRHLISPVTQREARIHLVNGMFGLGITELPSAIRRFGVMYAMIGIVLIGVITTHCLHILVRSMYRMYCRHRVPSLCYSDCMGYALQDRFKVPSKVTRYFSWCISFLVFLCQLILATAYVKYVAFTLAESFSDIWKDYISEPIMKAGLVIPLLLLNLVPTLKDLVYISIFGILVSIIAIVLILFDITPDFNYDIVRDAIDMREYPHFVGVTLLAFYILGTVILLEGNMKSAKPLVGTTGILNQTAFILIIIYVVYGFFCAISLQSKRPKRSIIDRIKLPLLFTHNAKFFLVLACSFSHPLMCYEMFEIVWTSHLNKYVERSYHIRQHAFHYVSRVAIVLLTVALAYVKLDDIPAVISLCGTLLVSIVGIILPCFLHLTTTTLTYQVILKDILVIFFGVSTFIGGICMLVFSAVEN